MILNSTHIFCLIPELEEQLTGLRIVRTLISSHQKDVLFSLGGRDKRVSLYFSSHSGNCRLEVWTEDEMKQAEEEWRKSNLFRYAVGGYVRKVEQVDFDRVIRISCGKKTQFGPGDGFDLVFESTGRNSNAILVKTDGTIVDCLRKIDATRSRLRQILPGERYVPPPAPKKRNPLTTREAEFRELIGSADKPAKEWLIWAFMGMDQLSARIILHRAGLNLDLTCSELSGEEAGRLWKALQGYFEDISKGKLVFQLVMGEDGTPQAIGCVDLPFVPDDQRVEYESMNSVIQAFFSERTEKERGDREINRLSRIVRRALVRLGERKEKIEQDLGEAERFEQFKRFGDLLMMNKEHVKKGQLSVELTDVFDPSQPSVEIPLDPKLGATANAQRYFKKHKKAKDALSTINKRRSDTEKKIDQLQEITVRLSRPGEEVDTDEIRESLVRLGVLKRPGSSTTGESRKKSAFRTFTTKTGWEILVGRNNKENDILTFKVARPDDLWFHARGLPGSHVLLRNENRKAEPSSGEIRQAAEITAYFSKARQEKKAEVAYTLAKYVRKPKRAKPGLALVENEKSILVKPGLPTES